MMRKNHACRMQGHCCYLFSLAVFTLVLKILKAFLSNMHFAGDQNVSSSFS